MSRALDKDVASLLQEGSGTAAYEAISKAITPHDADGELLEIEILGRGHSMEPGSYLLQDGRALAISKVGLVQAFFRARQLLQKYRGVDGNASDQQERFTEAEVSAATAVILLMDPEHLTAANTRKRLIGKAPSGGEDVVHRLRRERYLVDSLLTSRLHRHTKSPTLWSHRRWILEVSAREGVHLDVLRDVTGVIMVAGERHPRNYYAWCHARWLLEGLLPGLVQEPRFEKAVIDAVKDWCFRHHTDISGWSFLYFLLQRECVRGSHEVVSTTYSGALSLAGSLRWTNESVWVFVRTLSASGLAGEDAVSQFHTVLTSLKATTPEGSAERRVLERGEVWCNRYQMRK